MSAKTIRVLVVDDSALMREMICDGIEKAPAMEVAGCASDGDKALEALDRINPDVVTLDIQMPNRDGLSTLDEILTRRPVPVLMVSAHTRLGADITLDALDRGAIDYVAKPDSRTEAERVFSEELPRKIRSVAGTDVKRILEIRHARKQRRQEHRQRRQQQQAVSKQAPETGPTELADKCIALGISTGGPPALRSLFENLRPPMPPIVVVQHMPPNFTKALAWRLDGLSQLAIKEAAEGDRLQMNQVLIAPGGVHLELKRMGSLVQTKLRDGPQVSSHKPSVDVMMKSAAAIFGSRCLGVIMTGMGRDGSDGCGEIRRAGGYVLGQDEDSSDVYGMNKVAFVEGNVDRQFSLDEAARTLGLHVRRLWLR